MRGRLTLTALALLAVLACGHGTTRPDGSTRGSIELSRDVTVIFDDPVRKVPFDTRDVRLKRASEQLARLVGHRVAIHVDTALLPQYEATFHDMLIATLEGMARTVADFEDDTDALLFSDLMAVLHQVEVRYDASLDRSSGYASELDLGTKTLRVRMDGVRDVFVPGGLLWEELYAAQADVAIMRYRGTLPTEIPAEQHGYYLWYLKSLAASTRLDRSTASPAELDEGLDLEAIQLAQGLHALTTDAELAEEITEFVADRGTWAFYGQLEANSAVVAALGKSSKYLRARASWSQWMVQHMWSMREHTRDTFLRNVYGEDGHPLFTAVDPMGVGQGIIDRWIAQGRPGPDESRSPGPTYDQYLCPLNVENERRAVLSCHSPLYAHAWDDARRRAQLIGMLLERDDPALLRALTAWLRRERKTTDILELWDAVSTNDRAWQAVGREIGALELGRELLDELQPMWRKWPERRGTVLYIVAMHVRTMQEYYRKEFWREFEADFGAVDATAWRSFLGHGPRAAATAWMVLPVVGRFDRGEALARRLDELLDAESLEHDGFGDPVDALERTIEGMCARRVEGELESLRAGLDARTRRKPEEDKKLARAKRLTKC